MNKNQLTKNKYKFLREVDGKIKSGSGDLTWTIGEWKKHTGKIEMCRAGFHCSNKVYQAFSYVSGGVLAFVEVRGKSVVEDTKEVYSEMRIAKAFHWRKKDSVALAIYAAELVLENFEKTYPNDKCPREAIEAAKKVLKNDTEKNRASAASASASSAYSSSAAYAAASSAYAAAYAAASSAYAAAYAASSSASYAASSASYAASASAARADLLDKIDQWMIKRIAKLKEVTI